MKIGFIGAGRVGCSLGRYLKESKSGWELIGYYSKSLSSARDAADFTGSSAFTDVFELLRGCDVLAITTPDGAIADVWQELCTRSEFLKGRIVIHCSGAMTSQIFDGAESLDVTTASLHPFYAVSDRYQSYQALGKALFTIEGTGERFEELFVALCDSGMRLQRMLPEKKTTYHAAASVASNLLVGLTELSIELLCECGFDRGTARAALAPLMTGNLHAILEKDTFGALTGPAERGDLDTVRGHMDVLDGEDLEIYRLLTKKIVGIAQLKNPDRDYSALLDLLANMRDRRGE